MPDLVFHPDTAAAVQSVLERNPHALLIVGPSGSGKASLAQLLATSWLAVDAEALANYPYYKTVAADQGIAAIRELQQFASLKVPGTAGTRAVNRIAFVDMADQLGTEAQNALLKLLEEPPAGMVIMLSTEHERSMLPTIVSRAQSLAIKTPDPASLQTHFVSQGHEADSVKQVLNMTGGLPGMTAVLLAGDRTQLLFQAAEQARVILRHTTFERLLLVDTLSKQKDLAAQTVAMLIRMAQAALRQLASTASPEAAKRAEQWQHIMSVAAVAQNRLQTNGQAKLALTSLMLSL